ncbi:hypothetical protein [Candidatus Uabimicrobium amorphum]|uniref:Uncharacterized protein n=1 Tax=Uabimicrobium amorphum TaxID=2596890 RepID=A0A5S9F6A6_UABAM|nr:hypothetical protein [Candidatus Uabimicrobium amorphum]BBM87697.1 hypothetical protein UABAM_06112 [Candidatus Uabimicrobium amorphum]
MKIKIMGTVVVIISIFLLFFLKCDSQEKEKQKSDFDYFKTKANELSFDAEKIKEFINKDIITLSYNGDVKGALGTLWDGAGSKEEKNALEEKLLAYSEKQNPKDKSQSNTNVKKYKMKIVHRLLLPTGKGNKDTEVFTGHIGRFVGNIHSVKVPLCGKTAITIRAEKEYTTEFSTIGSIGEEIIFTISQPNGKSIEVRRELWNATNNVGPCIPLKGDRHDFVVLPCRISNYVLEKECMRQKAAGMEKTETYKHYKAILEYVNVSDRITEKIEKEEKVRATFVQPKIIFLSKYAIPKKWGGPAYSLDLRLNKACFTSEKSINAYKAELMRSFYESGAEHAFLKEWTGRPVTSAFDIFTRIRDDFPNRPAIRLKTIHEALTHFAKNNQQEGFIDFKSHRLGDNKTLSQIKVSRTTNNHWLITGDKLNKELLQILKNDGQDIPVKEGKLFATMGQVNQAALMIENALLAADLDEITPPDYLLETAMNIGKTKIFVPGTIYKMHNKKTGGQGIFKFKETDKKLSVEFKVWGSRISIPGSLVITEKARKEAIDFCSYWYNEHRIYNDKVSLIIPGPMYKNLKENKRAKYTKNSQKTMNEVTLKGTKTIAIKVNGKNTKFPVLIAKAKNADIIILDNPHLPLINFDRAEYISTTLKCKLTDSKGVGIKNAEIKMSGTGITATTAVDGTFLLPPAPNKVYGKVQMQVTCNGENYGKVMVDLSSPGLETVKISIPRKRIKIAWLMPKEKTKVNNLKISKEVRRHILHHMADARCIAVPERMISSGFDKEIAFFSFDVKTGYMCAVSENGLHLSTTNVKDARSQILNQVHEAYSKIKNLPSHTDGLKESFRKSSEKLLQESGLSPEAADAVNSVVDIVLETELEVSTIDTLHMYRGSLAAKYSYSGHRVNQEDKTDHKLAIKNTLRDMEVWAHACDLFSGIDDPTGGFASDFVENIVNKTFVGPISGERARKMFKYGYLAAVRGLDKHFGDK